MDSGNVATAKRDFPERSVHTSMWRETLSSFSRHLCDLPGYKAFSAQQHDAARRELVSHLAENQDDGFGWELLGLVLRELVCPMASVDAFEKASLIRPVSPLSQILLAEGYAILQHQSLARDLYVGLARSHDTSPTLLLLIAAGLDGIDEPHLAMQVCRRAAVNDPHSGQAAFDMGFYAQRCGLSPAMVEALMWRAVEFEPKNVHFRLGLISWLVTHDQADQACTVAAPIELAVLSDIHCVCCLRRLAYLYERSGDLLRHHCCLQNIELADV